MKFLKVVFSLLLTSALLSASLIPAQLPEPKLTQHKAMHRIVMSKDKINAGCTAYAIAPHVLLTAQHCDIDGGLLSVDNEFGTQTIAEKVYDNQDHMLLVLPNEMFAATINYDPATYTPPVQGERIYFWGNPRFMRDQYREGYMTGTLETTIADDALLNGVAFVFDVSGAPGDSGAAIFGSDGRLVTVVTYGFFGGILMGGYPLAFTTSQLKQATHITAANYF